MIYISVLLQMAIWTDNPDLPPKAKTLRHFDRKTSEEELTPALSSLKTLEGEKHFHLAVNKHIICVNTSLGRQYHFVCLPSFRSFPLFSNIFVRMVVTRGQFDHEFKRRKFPQKTFNEKTNFSAAGHLLLSFTSEVFSTFGRSGKQRECNCFYNSLNIFCL